MTYGKRYRIAIRLALCAAALGGLSLAWASSSGSPGGSSAYDAFRAKVAGNKTTVGYGSNGTPVVTSSAGLGTPHVVGNVGIDTASPAVKTTATLPLGNTGKTVDAAAKLPLNKGSVARGMVDAIKKAAPIGGGIIGGAIGGVAGSVVSALLDYGLSGLRLDDDGNVVGEYEDESIPSYPSNGYMWTGLDSAGYSKLHQSKEQAMQSYRDRNPSYKEDGACYSDVQSNGMPSFKCPYYYTYWGTKYEVTFTSNQSPAASSCAAGMYVVQSSDGWICSPTSGRGQLTGQALEDWIASRSGWPTSAARATAGMWEDASLRDILTADAGPVELTGPASVPGAQTTTQEPVKLAPGTTTEAAPGTTTGTDSGTKETTKVQTHDLTYDGPNVTYKTTVTTVTNITNNVTNQTNIETKTETTEKDAPDEPEKDDCEKRPDSLMCADLDSPQGEIPRKTFDVNYNVEDSFGNGSCPADVYSMVGGENMLIYDWQQTCGYISSYFRPVLLLVAAFAAMMILMPGRADG